MAFLFLYLEVWKVVDVCLVDSATASCPELERRKALWRRALRLHCVGEAPEGTREWVRMHLM
jgi:hypothetical protein